MMIVSFFGRSVEDLQQLGMFDIIVFISNTSWNLKQKSSKSVSCNYMCNIDACIYLPILTLLSFMKLVLYMHTYLFPFIFHYVKEIYDAYKKNSNMRI